MNLKELLEGLKNGTVTIDTKGHLVNPIIDDLEDDINNDLDFIKEMESGEYVEYTTKQKQTKEQCEGMIKFVGDRLERDLLIGGYINQPDIYCFDCGERLRLILINENTVSLVSPTEYRDNRTLTEEKRYIMDVTKISDCKARELRESGKMVSEIDVPSGKLLFTNFFKQDKIYDFPEEVNSYDAEHSINSIQGRNNLMQYLATQNIGYGQMGNMSVNVFVKDSGDEIIIGTDYHYNDEDDEEITIEHEGFTNLGSISLSVWRWMCGDIEVLKGHGEKLPKKLKVNTCIEDDYKDYILTDVKPGRWQIEHYYDFARGNDDPIIYSKLKLIK